MNPSAGPELLEHVEEIVFPSHLWCQAVAHARRKLEGRYEPEEERAPKAYGLVGGKLAGRAAEVTHVFPLIRNRRDDPQLKAEIDGILEELAVPSETPLERRGWVTDPTEVMRAERELEAEGSVLLGGYHMHRVAWAHDPERDTCTAVDTKLAEGSGLWMFILSMVDPERPVLRAYYEGRNPDDAPIRVVGPGPVTISP